MKILNIIKNIILDIVIVCLVVLIGFEFVNRGKPVCIFDHYLFVVMSGSMQKTLYVGDYIIVQKTDDYKVNDIITYKKDGKYITHRIVEIKDDTITTKGDANQVNDKPINKKNVIGKYVYKSGLLNFIMKHKIEIILVIIIIMLSSSLIKDKKRNKELEEEIEII